MDPCQTYREFHPDDKGIHIGYAIAVELQEYYDLKNFFNDYIGYKQFSILQIPEDRQYYESMYGKPRDSIPFKLQKQFELYLKKPDIINNPTHRQFKIGINNFMRDVMQDYNIFINCPDFVIDIINKIWEIELKWTNKTKDFLKKNIAYIIDLNLVPPKTVNKRTAISVVNEALEPGADTLVDDETLRSLAFDSGSRNKKRSSKRRPKRSSKRRPKRSSKRRTKRSSKRR
jgi:hypothetical protein